MKSGTSWVRCGRASLRPARPPGLRTFFTSSPGSCRARKFMSLSLIAPFGTTPGRWAASSAPATKQPGRVIGDRRLKTLRDLARTVMHAKAAEEACEVGARTLSENPYDVPFALIYLLEGDAPHARLVATAGLEKGSAAVPERIDLQDAAAELATWPLRRAFKAETPELVSDLAQRFGPLPGGPWPEAPEAGLIIPIATPGQNRPTGFVVAGLSPRRIFDTDYRSFFDLVAGHVGTALPNARTYEVERKRAEALAEIDRAKTAFFSNVRHELRTPLTLTLGPVADRKAEVGRSATPLTIPQFQQL